MAGIFVLMTRHMVTNASRRVVLLNYREDGITPYVTMWKHALKEEKV